MEYFQLVQQNAAVDHTNFLYCGHIEYICVYKNDIPFKQYVSAAMSFFSYNFILKYHWNRKHSLCACFFSSSVTVVYFYILLNWYRLWKTKWQQASWTEESPLICVLLVLMGMTLCARVCVRSRSTHRESERRKPWARHIYAFCLYISSHFSSFIIHQQQPQHPQLVIIHRDWANQWISPFLSFFGFFIQYLFYFIVFCSSISQPSSQLHVVASCNSKLFQSNAHIWPKMKK